MQTLILILITLILIYLFLILPQQFEAGRHKKVLRMAGVGDRVVTSGGLVGRITAVEEKVIHLEIAPGVVVTVHRDFIYRLVAPEPEATGQESSTQPG